jgi:hypothetical protein
MHIIWVQTLPTNSGLPPLGAIDRLARALTAFAAIVSRTCMGPHVPRLGTWSMPNEHVFAFDNVCDVVN